MLGSHGIIKALCFCLVIRIQQLLSFGQNRLNSNMAAIYSHCRVSGR